MPDSGPFNYMRSSNPTAADQFMMEDVEEVHDAGGEEGDEMDDDILTDVPVMEPPKPPPFPAEYIPATPFSTPYRSVFTLTAAPELPANFLRVISNAPCSYTSTAGIAPSMLELKQHAHSLVALIKQISISSQGGIIDNVNHGQPIDRALKFLEGEIFDFLNDLSRPYTGPKNPASREHHEMPLTALLNVLEERDVPQDGKEARPSYKVRNICPLHHVLDHPHPQNSQSLPYATHQSLIAHANEILELLDHEYSAKGGILGILPPKEDKEDREKAESTLFGQLILYVSQLVQRLHDLERLYANSMDVLAGEAATPAQTLSALGPTGRSGRDIVYPQDRFVLVNSGEDVWNYLDHEFQRRERVDDLVMQQYKDLGVTGEKLWENDGGKEMSRGITAMDVTTRYFRLRNSPNKTIFVIPAWQEHPGVKVTRDMENVQTVVSVVKPVWPERASMYEQKHREEMEDYKRMKDEVSSLRKKVEILDQSNTVMESQYELKTAEIRELKKDLAEMDAIVDSDETELGRRKGEQLKAIRQIHAQEEDAAARLQEAEDFQKEAAEERTKAREERMSMERLRQTQLAENTKRMKDLEETYSTRLRALQQKDIDNGEAVVELDRKVKERWTQQIVDTQVIFEELKAKQRGAGEGRVTGDSVEKGMRKGEKIARDLGLMKPVVVREGTVESSFRGEGESVGYMSESASEAWAGGARLAPRDETKVPQWDFSSLGSSSGVDTGMDSGMD